jgi:hypothetical protein
VTNRSKRLSSAAGSALVGLSLLRLARERFIAMRYNGVIDAIDDAIVGATARLAQLEKEIDDGK